ncbi:MAG TPA: hypothetical protein PK335_02330, partial [Draconibacterium sp.]|nr:hypothetical protein [Draconibacterium sp.]
MKTKLAFVVLAGTALFFSACSEKESQVDSVLTTSEDIKSTEVASTLNCDTTAFSEVLSEEEVAGLLEMR